MSINFGYRDQFVPWVRDGFVPDILYQGQPGCMRSGIMDTIDSAQHRPLKRGSRQLRELENMEVTVSVVDDAIDHMMGVGRRR